MATTDTDTDTTETKPKGAKGGRTGARARIEVEGDVDPSKVSDVLDAAGRGGRGRRDSAAAADPDQKFARVIRNPRNKIIAARLQPQTMADGTPLNDTLELPCHEGQSIEEIKRDIAEARGGRKWIIRVFDSNEDVVASRAETIGGLPRMDPMLEGMETEPENTDMEQQTELTDAEVLERTLAADPDVVKAQKKLRLKQIQAEEEEEDAKLDEVRARRAQAQRLAKGETEPTNGNGKHKHDDEDETDSKLLKAIEAANAPLKEANAALQRRLDDAERRNSEKESKAEQQRMIEAQTGPLKQMLEDQRKQTEAILAKLNAPAPTGPTTDAILTRLEALKTEIKSDTKEQIMTVVSSLTDKINTVATTLNTFMAKGSDPATNALIALATQGGKGGAASTDPFHGLERALTVLQNVRGLTEKEAPAPPDFPSYLVEKMAETTPEVLNFFREQRGAVPSKEEIEKMMRGAAMNMYKGLNETMQKELQAAFQRIQNGQPAALPAAQPAQPSAQAHGPEVVVAPTAQGATPTPVAFPGSAAPAASPATPAAATAAVLTPQQLWDSLNQADRAEYSKRVNYVLGGLAREMEIGANEMQWPQHAIDKLPRKMIEQFVEATTDTEVYEIIRRYADAKLLDRIWSFLSASHPKHEWYQGWLATGINWIKEAEGVEVVQPTDEAEPPVVDDVQQ
jgi:hypothetical protein